MAHVLRAAVVDQWTHDVFLDSEKRVRLRWTPRPEEIEFLVEGRATGFVGIGFSPNGGMDGADIALGWVDPVTDKKYLVVSTVPDIHYPNNVHPSLCG